MDFLDGLIHVINLFVPALGLGALAPALAKLVWWRALRGRRWWALAWPAMAAAAAVALAGLVLTGRDGKMATYATMVVVVALALWWRAFFRPAR